MQEEKTIKCVKSATWNLIWKKYKNWTIFLTVSFFLIIFSFPFYIVYVPVVFLIYYIYLRGKVHKEFMVEFALMNGFDYKEKIPIDSVKGSIFNFGNSKTIKHAITGNYNDKKIRLFNYQTTTGSGRSQKIHFFTVFEIFFEKIEFPSIFLQAKKRWFDRIKFFLKKNITEIKLENELNKYFSLFCTEGYEIEALQVFTREALLFLKEKELKFSVEMISDRLYVYDEGLIFTRKQLYELYGVVQFVIDSLGPLLKRLGNDFEVLHKYYNKG